MNKKSGSICVIGDVTLDCNIARLPASKTETDLWNDKDQANVTWERGGAALLTDVIRHVLPTSPVAGQTSWTVCGPKTPDEAQINDHAPFPRSYTVWTPHRIVNGQKVEKKVWRVERFLGLSKTESAPVLESACETPDILVINDAHLGFSDKPVFPKEWSVGKRKPRWILLKTSQLDLDNPLWRDFLSKHAERLIVMCTASGLRKGDAQISKGISWERTVQDVLWELNFKKFGKDMLTKTPSVSCTRVIVSFGAAGTLIFNPQAGTDKDEGKAQLIFDPQAVEGSWEAQHPGHVMGYFSGTAAAIVLSLTENMNAPDLVTAAHTGIHAFRSLHSNGYGKVEKTQKAMVFPHDVVTQATSGHWITSESCCECKRCKTDTLACVPVPFPVACSSQKHGAWSILKSKTDLNALAKQIVQEGIEMPLKGVPTAKFGKFETADLREIENYRSVRNLLAEFICTQGCKPVSIAVFGPPGSGKSFGVKALAEELAPSLNVSLEIRTFNLSQFQAESSDELNNALHQVRDITLSGKIPLVFWDEFDTNDLGWLRRFLEPMQDGTFLEGQVTHPIGKAIFVFAGGTCNSLADFSKGLDSVKFRNAKVPDFISRLRGYLDIMGPNPVGGNPGQDPAFIVRRAILLRSMIERICPLLLTGGKLNIDEGVLDAFLHISNYKHGARSMESLVLSSSLAGKLRFDRSSLPQMSQLDVHVNGAEFFARVSMIRNPEFLKILEKAVHENYYEKLIQRGYSYADPAKDELKTSSSLKPYEELSEALKQDNRNAAMEMPEKLALAGYAIVPDRMGDGVEIPKNDIEIMAEREHNRWLRNKIATGWKYGRERNNETKLHPAMLPWHEVTEPERAALYPENPEAVGMSALPDSEKQKDRDQFDGLPAMLKKYGYAVSKLVK